MALKISANMSAVAHHIIDGAVPFPYAIDAHSAVSHHPYEWSHEPWTAEDAAAAQQFVKERYEREREEAEMSARDVMAARHGVVMPARPRIDEPLPPTPEEQAAIDEHAQAVAEANERLKAFREKQAEQKKIDEQVAADEALVKSPPPRPDPNRPRRPFGRKGEPTAAELEQIEKREKKKAEDERIAREKAEQDRMNNSNAKMTT